MPTESPRWHSTAVAISAILTTLATALAVVGAGFTVFYANRAVSTAEQALNRETRQAAYVDFMEASYAFRTTCWSTGTDVCWAEPDLLTSEGQVSADRVMQSFLAVRLAGGSDVSSNSRGCLIAWNLLDEPTAADVDKPVQYDVCRHQPGTDDEMLRQLDGLTTLMHHDVG